MWIFVYYYRQNRTNFIPSHKKSERVTGKAIRVSGWTERVWSHITPSWSVYNLLINNFHQFWKCFFFFAMDIFVYFAAPHYPNYQGVAKYFFSTQAWRKFKKKNYVFFFFFLVLSKSNFVLVKWRKYFVILQILRVFSSYFSLRFTLFLSLKRFLWPWCLSVYKTKIVTRRKYDINVTLIPLYVMNKNENRITIN